MNLSQLIMGCCSSSPPRPHSSEDDNHHKPDALDEEISEHAGHTHFFIPPKSKTSVSVPDARSGVKVFDNRHPPLVDPTAVDPNSILNRINQSLTTFRKPAFFGGAWRGDPAKILRFLTEKDLGRLARVSKSCRSMTEAFIVVKAAKEQTGGTEKCLGFAARGDGGAWVKLKKKLAKESNLNLPEEEAEELTVGGFKEKYEGRRTPVLVKGAANEWKAFATPKVWSLDSLAARFGETLFRFNDLHGEEIRLDDYLTYARSTDDDSPLGLYDSQIGVEENDPRAVLLQEYAPPPFFGEDLFGLISHGEHRPPYRWILLGVPRSGTAMHVDPLETSAWVTLLSGKKKWVMFPPGTQGQMIGGVHVLKRKTGSSTGSTVEDVVIDGHGSEDAPSACEWFQTYWGTPATKVEGAVFFTQCPGDTVFVPGGWPHVVINLEETVAITHNYAPVEALERIRIAVKDTEPDFSQRWELKLKQRGLVR